MLVFGIGFFGVGRLLRSFLKVIKFWKFKFYCFLVDDFFKFRFFYNVISFFDFRLII